MVDGQDNCKILLPIFWRIWNNTSIFQNGTEMKHTWKAEEARVQNNLTMGCSIFCSFHTIELEFILLLESRGVCHPFLEFLPGCIHQESYKGSNHV